MKLLAHSNGIHKVGKDKINKRKILKNCIIFIVGLLIFGFSVQMITNFFYSTRLKSRFKYIRIDGNKMEYKYKSGGDYTVVFDGAIGINMYEWDEACSTLEEKKVSTFIYNRRGYGFNDGGEIRTTEEQAKDLRTLLKKAGASEPYILVGEEYGSLVTTSFIKLYPDLVAGVVLVNPISEEEIQTNKFKESIKSKYYRSEFEKIGANFGLTTLLSKMGLTIENNTFKEHLTESELYEFNSFKNNNKYKKAVSNELKNLYKGVSNSQVDGLLSYKPLYLITDNEDDPIKKLGDATITTVYKEETNSSPFSVLDSNTIVNGVNSVIKDAKKSVQKQ